MKSIPTPTSSNNSKVATQSAVVLNSSSIPQPETFSSQPQVYSLMCYHLASTLSI